MGGLRNAFLWAIVGLGFIFICSIFGKYIPYMFSYLVDLDNWKEQTKPLSEETKLDLCEKFQIDNNNICDKGRTVYSPDLFPIIYDFFNFEDNTVYREDVENKLGDYLTECETPTILNDGTGYYACFYDLAGDEVFPIFALYNADGILFTLLNSTD
jgi:hypothetical protein